MEQIGFHGAGINTFPSTVEVVGLMLQQVPCLTELTLLETEHGQIFPYHPKCYSIAKLEDHAMVELQLVSTRLPNNTVFHKKLAKHIRPRIHKNSHVLIFKNA